MHILAPLGLRLRPGKRGPHIDRAGLGPLAQLRVRVQVVERRVAAAVEQQDLADVRAAAPALRRALLHEPAHRREPGARAEEHERHARVRGERKGGGRRPHGDLHAVPRREPRQEVRRDAAEVVPRPRECGRRDDRDGERAVARVPERRGRDRVLAHAHRREHVDECTQGNLQRRVGNEDIEDTQTLVDYCCLVILEQFLDGGFSRLVCCFQQGL